MKVEYIALILYCLFFSFAFFDVARYQMRDRLMPKWLCILTVLSYIMATICLCLIFWS